MRSYEFDVKFFASITVEASTEAEARRMLSGLSSVSVNAGAWPNGDAIVFDIASDGAPDLTETRDIDGSAIAFASERCA